ncbi:MAG: ABC transporter ATP-binding protein [Oscillospiraceae bacterium]|nr:ABC transporter ATP-binding protein [Oscillospiraceae bacterium]
MNAIEICGLCKSYPGFSLRGVNLTLPEGCILGLVGENGAGKSTTIQLIMDAVPRDSGEIRVLGADNRNPDFRAVKEDIGVVLDEAFYPEVLNAKNVDTVMKHTYKRWDSAAFSGYLARFSLPTGKAFKEFSRGMKMKLAIAVALSHHPRLLILDEATSGLDPIIRDEILDIFNEFTRDPGHSVLLSSHILSDMEKICDYVAFLHRGKLTLCEEKDRLLEEYAVLKLPAEALEAVPPEAILGRKDTVYGSELLVRRGEVSPAFPLERATLEEIILLMANKEDAK